MPWLSCPVPTFESMSSPTDCVKNAMPLRITIAMNHGSTSRIIHATPGNGLSRINQRGAARSAMASAATVNPTNMNISGPLRSAPTASAVQNTPGSSHG